MRAYFFILKINLLKQHQGAFFHSIYASTSFRGICDYFLEEMSSSLFLISAVAKKSPKVTLDPWPSCIFATTSFCFTLLCHTSTIIKLSRRSVVDIMAELTEQSNGGRWNVRVMKEETEQVSDIHKSDLTSELKTAKVPLCGFGDNFKFSHRSINVNIKTTKLARCKMQLVPCSQNIPNQSQQSWKKALASKSHYSKQSKCLQNS